MHQRPIGVHWSIAPPAGPTAPTPAPTRPKQRTTLTGGRLIPPCAFKRKATNKLELSRTKHTQQKGMKPLGHAPPLAPPPHPESRSRGVEESRSRGVAESSRGAAWPGAHRASVSPPPRGVGRAPSPRRVAVLGDEAWGGGCDNEWTGAPRPCYDAYVCICAFCIRIGMYVCMYVCMHTCMYTMTQNTFWALK